jgi:hypothetical protein
MTTMLGVHRPAAVTAARLTVTAEVSITAITQVLMRRAEAGLVQVREVDFAAVLHHAATNGVDAALVEYLEAPALRT